MFFAEIKNLDYLLGSLFYNQTIHLDLLAILHKTIKLLIDVKYRLFYYRYPFTPEQKIAEPDWQVFLRDTAKTILQEQSPAKLMVVRTRLYELLVHGIPVNIVFKVS